MRIFPGPKSRIRQEPSVLLFALDCLLGKLTIEYSNVQRGGKKPTCFCEFDIQGGLVFEYKVGIAKFNRKKVISQ